jgi:hypothetical protein
MQIRQKDNGANIITLDGNEVAIAIDEYIKKRNVKVSGARTIRVDAEPEDGLATAGAKVYVDPTGDVSVEDIETEVLIIV